MPRRACDRCHGIRARCEFGEDRDVCERCARLGHTCRTERSLRKAGRPRKTWSSRKVSDVNQIPPAEDEDDAQTSQTGDLFDSLQDFEPAEIQLARYFLFLQNQRFANSFVGLSGLDLPLQATPIRLLLSAPRRVKDALLALAGVMMNEEGESSPLGTNDALESMSRCCKALERLRETDTSSVDDARATLFVATTLISCNDMMLGCGVLPIARAALLSVAPWYHELMDLATSDFDPHLIPVMFAEVAECTRCREVPTLRYYGPTNEFVDPSFGIAHELLPNFYDICELSHDMKFNLLETSLAELRAGQILENIQLWSPTITTNFQVFQQFQLSDQQRKNIITHGECYRLLALLLLHQLHPQLRDGQSDGISMAAKLRYDITTIPDQNNPQVQYLLFPYFVSCTEIQDEFEQGFVLDQMKFLSGGIATQSCNRMFEFLKLVWAARSISPATSWFDLVEEGVEFSIGP